MWFGGANVYTTNMSEKEGFEGKCRLYHCVGRDSLLVFIKPCPL